MIHLYAFARGLHELPDEDGLSGVALAPGVDAIVGPALGDGHEDVVRHGLVVQALIDAADAVLPARFGERFADVAALHAAVRGRTRDLEQRLAEIDGCVELTVRVGRADERYDAPDGTAYMRARLRAITADAAAAEALHSLLRAASRETVVASPVLSRLLHDACYLVERPRVDEFVRRVEDYAAAHPELSFACTGPWAPASFAEAA
jgi:hypothetical protein